MIVADRFRSRLPEFSAMPSSSIRTLLAGALLFVCGALVISAQKDSPAPRRDALATVLDYGAIGDGQADDTAAIQRAVDEGRGAVVFPPGTYKLTKTVEIDLAKVGITSLVGHSASRVVMAGSGPAFRFRGTHEGTADPDSVKPQVWDKERMPTIEALAIEGAHEEA